ncbi:MAG: hypothetical protein L0Z73_02885 [Gammaproteobacteria bacterium]|nr:hypothetical protein [Gammaproteobacteria bacterium]
MKHTMLINSLLASMVLWLSACGQMPEGEEGAAAATGNQAEYEELYNKTMEDYKKVEKQGGAWRDTKELLEKAEEAAKKKDYAAAAKLAKEASYETQNAAKQFEEQKKAGPYLF